jgi:thiol:disulfide interchange protein DsbD
MKTLYALVLLFLLVTIPFSHAQNFQEPDILNAELFFSVDKIQPGSTFELALVLNIQKGLHINSHTPSQSFLIPTQVRFKGYPGVSFGPTHFPAHKVKSFAFSEEPIAVYEDEVMLRTVVTLSPELDLDRLVVEATLSYQGCDDNTCFVPQEKVLTDTLEVAEPGETVNQTHAQIFSSVPDTPKDQDTPLSLTADERRAKEIIEKGILYAIAAFFVIGLALNLTPCVYPVIPMTVSYFGGTSDRTTGSSFTHALFYLIGIALSFALLGLVSGLAGQQWGFLFASPWFVVVISLIILSMAASLFGAFEITVPSWLLTKLGGSRQGVLGSFIMGITVGVVIAPCAAGIIIGLVGLVAKLGLVTKGALLFFVMGLGLGVPYLILATFSGLLNKLPQSGMWMVWIRKLFGILLVGVAVYFLLPQLERVYDKLGFMLSLVTLFGGLLLGFLDQSSGYSRPFSRARKVFGIIVMVLGMIWMNHALAARASQINWIHVSSVEELKERIDPQKPTFIDFYADWCAPCKQMDRETFRDPRVAEVAKNMNMVKVDCTAPDSQTRALMNAYQVSGMPTLVFKTSDQTPVPELRKVGYLGSEDMIEQLETLD